MTENNQKSINPVHTRRRRQSGMMLVTVLGLMTCMIILMSSAALLASNMIQTTRTRIDKTDSANMADSGVDLGLAWIKAQSYPPDLTQTAALANFWGATKDAAGRAVFTAPFGKTGSTLVIGVYPDNANPSASQKRYIIESKATMNNGISTIVRAYAQQNSFGKYAFFANDDDGGFYNWDNHFEGPFHSNAATDGSNTANGGSSMFLWRPKQGTDTPIFLYDGPGALETTIEPRWWRNTIGNVSPPANDAEWKAVATGGRASISVSPSNFIPLPTTSYAQMHIALAQDVPAVTTVPRPTVPNTIVTGVNVSSNGSMYLKGNSTITMNGATPGVQQFTIVTKPTAAPNETILTQTVVANSTSITVTSTLKKADGTTLATTGYPNGTTTVAPNGLMFSEGDVSLSGTVADNAVNTTTNAITRRNEWTIFADTANSKKVTIADSITYTTQRDFTKPQAEDGNYNLRAGTLGIVAKDVIVANTVGGVPKVKIDVHADIFCTGEYRADKYADYIGAGANMTNVGGVIVQKSGLFGIVDNNGNATKGRTETYRYDSRLADNPPPFFPTTGNRYTITSYQIVGSQLQ